VVSISTARNSSSIAIAGSWMHVKLGAEDLTVAQMAM
jgi:hypothetical protein